jgi:hypothetical protein
MARTNTAMYIGILITSAVGGTILASFGFNILIELAAAIALLEYSPPARRSRCSSKTADNGPAAGGPPRQDQPPAREAPSSGSLTL